MEVNFLNLQFLQNKAQKVNKYSQNPLNFKGTVKPDSFVKDNNERLSTSRINELLVGIQEELDATYKAKREVFKKILENDSRAQNASDEEKAELNKKYKELSIKHKEHLANSKRLQKTIEYYESLKVYNTQYEKNPNTAFLYDPDLSPLKKRVQLKEKPEILSIRDFSRKACIDELTVRCCIKSDLIDADEFEKLLYIDTSYKKNVLFLEKLNEKIKTSMPIMHFASKYNMSEKDIVKHIKNGTLVPVIGGEHLTCASDYIDLEDDINSNTIKRHCAKTPVRSEYAKHLVMGGKPVPVAELARLGYGTKEEIIELLKKGSIDKTICLDDEGNKILCVNTSSDYTENMLLSLRKENKSLIEKNKLAKVLKMSTSEIDAACLDGKLKIVPEFIFSSEHKNVYFDARNIDNKKFVSQRLTELKLEDALKLDRHKQVQSENGLRTKIAWELSPETRKAASQLAKGDGYLAKIFEKVDNDEQLSRTDNIKLKDYYKTVWIKAGTDEFKEAHKKAKEILDTYKKYGLDSIEDPIIKATIADFYNEVY